MALLLDTSFLIAFDNENDTHHNKARDLWPQIKERHFGVYFISDYIFDEIIAVTIRKKNKERAKTFGQQIRDSLDIINIDSYLIEEAWKLFNETKTNLNFTDCTNLALLNLLGNKKIATFDKGFIEINDIETIN